MFCLNTSSRLPTNNLNFHWRWQWWDQIHAIMLNLFYFNNYQENPPKSKNLGSTRQTNGVAISDKSIFSYFSINQNCNCELKSNICSLQGYIYEFLIFPTSFWFITFARFASQEWVIESKHFIQNLQMNLRTTFVH